MAAKVQWDTTHDDVIKEYNSTKLLWDEAFENTNPKHSYYRQQIQLREV